MPHTTFDNTVKQMLEDLFEMSGGYVMDFSNANFASFVEQWLGVDPYDRYQGSKAAILRQIWTNEPSGVVAQLNLDLLEHWRIIARRDGKTPTDYEQEAIDTATTAFQSVNVPALSEEDVAFLNKDLGSLNLDALPSELTAGQVIADRMGEIERALEADAPLAVIFLVGSTVEGLLSELAMGHRTEFLASPAAPTSKGKTKPLDQWKLSELIAVARERGVLSEDVAKHADQVRNFRNYIHPRQQLKEGFAPRIETARIAQQVLKGVLSDLERLTANPTS
ncbi:hypothetical protein [Corynebacterium variabile]|uniref:Uncharacterized protein n=1 Tax=Corynebacterium variabile TaxID=1727 RepID=A0A4Y4C397_9CORY|nr:hypothetical protein [Corynebacterium variabile]GEC87505.1 hypothetical protein CVA01_28190 [Corynebacterium variabile]